MSKQRFCFLQVSDRLINPVDVNNPADVYFKEIWNHLDGEGYFKPEHYWEIPTWVAELNYCLFGWDCESILYNIESSICILPDADTYLGSIMDCNKEYFRLIAKNNPEKSFYFGGYIGQEDFWNVFKGCFNVTYHISIEAACIALDLNYRYGTDYSLFRETKCIPRLTLSNGCTNHCRFCTVPDEIIETDWRNIAQQIESMKDLDFELIYINDKTFGQCHNYKHLELIYRSIAAWNPKFRGFTVQTTCQQIRKFWGKGINLKDLGIVNVEIGVESFNNEILQKYNKPQNTSSIAIAVDMLEEWNVNIIPNIIIGLPGEDIFTCSETLKWVDDNKHRFLMLNVTNFVPYEGSEAVVGMTKNEGDENQTTIKRSWHTEKETIATEVFSELLFEIGMEIIKNTKARLV